MTDFPDFNRIRELCDEHYEQGTTKEEYRQKRTLVLNKIDLDINGIPATGQAHQHGEGFVDKVMSFFKQTDEEKIL